MRVEVVTGSWERDDELAELLYAELYRDFGVVRDAQWRHEVAGCVTLVALDESGELLGTARLLPAEGDPERQVRQVAVARHARGCGVGGELMRTLEEVAASQGAREVWLNARDTAIPFYERAGYVGYGDTFVSELTGIVHRAMRKPLT